MNDDAVGGGFAEIEALLPPRATEYRSGEYRAGASVGAQAADLAPVAAGASRDEPATVPLTVPPMPIPRTSA